EPAAELRLVSTIRLEHFPAAALEFPVEPYAKHHPFSYSTEEVPDLGCTIERHYPDPDHRLDGRARRFLIRSGETDTQALPAGRRMGGVRPDERTGRRSEAGSRRRHARPEPGHPRRRHVDRRAVRLSRHDRRRTDDARGRMSWSCSTARRASAWKPHMETITSARRGRRPARW